MDRSFIIPIAVAAGVHSMLFISGSPKPPPHVRPPEQPVERWAPIDLPPLDVIDPPISENPGEKANTAKPPPISSERMTTLPHPDDFIQEAKLQDLRPPPAQDVTSIDRGWQDALTQGNGSDSGPFSLIALDNHPAARFQPAPGYPRDLRSLGEDGTATVSFSVDVNGNVFNATVTRSTHSSFGEEALRAVRRWRFEPGIKDGKRVAFRMIQSFTFSLEK